MNKIYQTKQTVQTNKVMKAFFVRYLMILALLLGVAGTAEATDYIITYTSGGTTYYIGMDGTNLVAKTVPDATCVWTAINRNDNTENSLSTTSGNNYRRRLRNKNNTSYFLNASVSRGGYYGNYTYTWNITASTTGSQYWYGAEGTSLYHTDNTYNRGNGYLHNTGSTVTISTSTANSFVPYAVTVTTVNSTSTGVAINSGADLLTATGNSNYTTQSAAYQIGYTNYKYNNNTNHYVDANGNSFTGTPAAANISYLWSLTPNDYASVSGTTTTGTVNVSSLPETDITLTLTVTATAAGGTPAAPANTTFTDSKQITIQGTKPTAPIISVSGTTVTLSTTAVGSTSIRYTTDGTDPTASTGTVYSGAFDISGSATSPVTIKAITVRSGNASDVSTETVTLTLPAPTITANAAAGTATIACATAGVTIHYTTDGSTPTTSSATYSSSLSGLSPMTTIKAIAVKDGWNNSPVASETVRIPSGVSDGVVTLFDYEDHSWSYYSDPDCPIHSLNPADVKITYNGNGTGTVQTNNSDSPSTWGADATTVKVGIDANASTFIYYETLERTDGRTAASVAAATGRCAYTTIANPFSVRPTYSSDATSVYRGFYAWRVKSLSGGTIHSAATGGTSYGVGSTINAETEIYFAPSSEYGMEVEFEALWARAYVSTTGAPNNSLGVERNFYVITASATSNITAGSYPCTYTSIYPNGTTNGTTAANSVTVYKYGGFTASADSKIEYIILRNNSSTVNANGKNFTIGRGVSGYNGGLCATNLYGLNGNATTSFKFNFASGRFTNLYFCGDGRTMSSGVLTSVIGCDYDRAMGDNDNLEITSDIIAGHNGNGGSNNNEGKDFFRCTVKSGDFDLGDYGGGAQFYLSLWGNTGSGTYGKKTMIVEGGIFSDISGGIDVEDNDVSAVDMVEIRVKGGTVNGALYGAAQYAAAYGNRYIIITGGEMKGWVAGGANGTQTTGGKLTGNTYVYFGGNARCDSEGSNTTMGSGNATGGNIFGAGSGNSGAADNATVGEVNQSTVVIADNAYVERNVYGGGNYGSVAGTGADNKSEMYILGGTVHGNVFGGSNMKSGNIVNYNVRGGTVNGGIYGGSNARGSLSGNVTMDISGGTIEGGVFGGGYGTNTNSCDVSGTVGITMTGGTVLGGLYGGGNVNSKISDAVTININGGQVGEDGNEANVHGGGLGNLTRALNSVTVNIGSRTDCNVSGSAVIYGDVYGGSAEGKTNGNTARENNAVTNVTLNKGTINGSLYGGGLGSASYAADVYGPVAVKVYGGTLTGGVYGANNVKGAPQNSVTVDIYGTDPQPGEGYAIANVYGGGNQAAYNNANYPTVTVHNNNNSIGNVYGGGNAAAVTNTKVTIFGGNRIGAVYAGGNGTGVSTTFSMVMGNANAYICGGTIGRVFAGNNSSGIVSGTKYVRINADSTEAVNDANCIVGGHHDMKIGSVFQGGNQANGSPGTVKIVCTGLTTDEYIDTLFGGANNANIVNNDMGTAADVTLNIDRGHIRTGIFGGNNSGGNITGDIEINLTRNSGSTCAFPYPSVFGGGFGAATTTGGDITLNIGEKDEASTAPTIAATIEGGAIYGGSALGSVNGSSSDKTEINIYNCTITTGNIYGGGLGESDNANKGKVNGDITVNISTEDQAAADCVTDIHTSSIYGCNNTGGSPQGNVTVHVWKTGLTTGNYSSASTGTLYAIDQVFGGGNAADYAPAGDNKATVYIHDCINSIRRVFGGGNAAAAKGVVTTIDGGRYDYIFGGGNGEGEDNPGADIGSGGTNLTVKAGRINHLFGGSNERGTIGGQMRTDVNYNNIGKSGCDELIIEFFGGGNLAEIGTSEHPVNLSTTIACNTVFTAVYGGSNLADIYGDVTLTIEGGTIGEVYGGSKGRLADNSDPQNLIAAKAADIHGNVKLNIYGGDIGRAYGGSNINGDITGAIGVDLDWKGDCPGKSVDYIYGGSNQAAYTPTASGALSPNFSPTVKLINGVVNYNVYGGGRGGSATVTANPKVIAGDGTTPTNSANVQGDIFGGGDAANVTGKTNVRVVHNSKVGGNVFGGGNAAEVSQDTEVEIKDQARIGGNVYGGGNEGAIGGNTKVIINSSK